jgi:hypothetical protein
LTASANSNLRNKCILREIAKNACYMEVQPVLTLLKKTGNYPILFS